MDRSRTLPVLFAIAALAGCADAPHTLIEPAAPAFASTGRELQKVQGSLPEFHVEAVIGAEGGSFGVPGYTVIVPRHAVAQPTRFTFESLRSGYLEVRLTATELGSGDENGVGRRGFATPVLLSIGYEPAGGMPQWARLVVAWVRDDGSLERVPTGFDPVRRQIVGRLSHFSQYAVASD